MNVNTVTYTALDTNIDSSGTADRRYPQQAGAIALLTESPESEDDADEHDDHTRHEQQQQHDTGSSGRNRMASVVTEASNPQIPNVNKKNDFEMTRKNDINKDDDVHQYEHFIQLPAYFTALVWPLMMTLPLSLTWSVPTTLVVAESTAVHTTVPLYQQIFPSSWYEYDSQVDASPKPLGLILGIVAVAIGQVCVWIMFYLYKYGYLYSKTPPMPVQTKGARPYEFQEGLMTHISQPEGFVLLIGYLALTWMFRLMPNSYYSFNGSIQYKELFACLVLQDGIQYSMHYLEHVVSPKFYQMSHKPHHRFTNPRLFDAFNGSLTDTLCMIVIPLFLTANVMRTCNVWTYMAFGSVYACWLTLIHSEYVFPWDAAFRKIGFGTPADHHVHHKVFKYNYGHLFMWFDQIAGTYKDPNYFAPKIFREGA